MRKSKLVGLTVCAVLFAASAARAQRGTTLILNGGLFRTDPGLLLPRCHVTVPAPVRGAHASAVPADYDGDGRVDVAVKQDDGEWSIDYAANGFGAWDETRPGFGPAYYTPVPGDYDGDGKADLATKDDAGAWYIDYASNGFGSWDQILYGYGDGSVKPVPADYDGDCKVDLAIKDVSGTWYIDYAANGFGSWDAIYPGYGGTTSIPVPADYDGDGRADLAVKDNVTGHWIIDFASNGFGHWDVSYPGFGGAEFAPVPADYDGDGKTDLASRDAWDNWYIDYAANGRGSWDEIHGGFAASANYLPVPADYDGDHRADLASHTDGGDWLLDFASDGFGFWNQVWNSYVTVSAGHDVTAEDVRKFDSKWMQADQLGGELFVARSMLENHFGRGGWGIAERVEAMLRMYESTRQTRFLDQASFYIDAELEFRDDHHPAGPPLDEVRGVAGLAAWGGRGLGTANLYTVDETISNVYAHPIAAFARIVAEDPTLQPVYGERAIAYADAVVQTIRVFLPQMRFQNVNGKLESYLALNPNLASVVTEAMCDRAGADALAAANLSADDVKDINQLVSNCKGYRNGAGYPMAHNEENLFLMVLIETSRVLDSPFYRAQSPNSIHEEGDRVLYPLLVSYGYRFFQRHLDLVSGHYEWNHVDDGPGVKVRRDDAFHAVESMRYIALLNRDLARLNARLVAAGGPPIQLDATDLRQFANTFLGMTANGHIADNVAGAPANPIDSKDSGCDGWLGLSGVEPQVFDRCSELSLRVVDGTQKNLGIANHAALLAAKNLRWPLLVWTGTSTKPVRLAEFLEIPMAPLATPTDSDLDGVADDVDNCPFFANPVQSDRDGNHRGDACECGDQNGDGTVNASDIVAINQAIFDPSRVTPLCDASGDGLCNASDIVAVSREIFSPGSTSTCARQPVAAP